MAWSEAARAQHGRPHDDGQDDLTDAERALTAPPVPTRGRPGRPRATDPRRVFDAIRSMLSSGCRWRLVPPCHPPSSTVRNCFDVWRNDGTPERMPDALRVLARAQAGRGVAPTGAIIDRRRRKAAGLRDRMPAGRSGDGNDTSRWTRRATRSWCMCTRPTCRIGMVRRT